MITVEVRGIDDGLGLLARVDKGTPIAAARALNRAITFGRTTARRSIMTETALPSKYITPSLDLARARPSNLAAALRARPRNVPLIAYLHTGFKSGRGIGGQPYNLGSAPPRAFYAQFASGYKGIFERAGKARTPVRQIYGPTIPEVVIKRGVFAAMTGPVGDYFRKRLAHEISFYFTGTTPPSEAAA